MVYASEGLTSSVERVLLSWRKWGSAVSSLRCRCCAHRPPYSPTGASSTIEATNFAMVPPRAASSTAEAGDSAITPPASVAESDVPQAGEVQPRRSPALKPGEFTDSDLCYFRQLYSTLHEAPNMPSEPGSGAAPGDSAVRHRRGVVL